MIQKCPYCFEALETSPTRCPHCSQFLIDDILSLDYPSIEKKKCIYCGKSILQEARICKYCHKWLDELDRAISDIDPEDLV